MIQSLQHAHQNMVDSLNHLREQLLRKKPACWLARHDNELTQSPLQLIAELISDLWYRDGQDGRETRSRHGLVLIDEETATLITQVNHFKDEFRTQVQRVKKELERDLWQQQYQRLGEHSSPLRDAMTFSGLSRLHLKQCYRHIPLLPERPDKVGFSWYVNGRSIRNLSLMDAQNMLLALGEDKPHIQLQLDKLSKLPSHIRLAQVQTLAPVVRANLVFKQAGITSRKAMNVPLPLFMLDDGRGLPLFNDIAATPPPGRTRQQRNDQRIEPEPFLPSLRIHLYRE